MKKQSYHRIEPTTPAGWYKIVRKDTGACVENVKGYAAAVEVYRRKNREANKRSAPCSA